MAGAALRGMGKVLAKHLRKAPVLGKRVKGAYPKAKPRVKGAYPTTKPRGKGDYPMTEAARGILPSAALKGVKAPKIPSIKKTTRDLGKYGVVAGLAYAAGKTKAKKEAKAKEIKGKLKKSAEEHKKKTKEKREKYGKHHG